MANEDVTQTDLQEIEVGEEIAHWETWDHPPQERSKLWYVLVSCIGIGLVAYSVVSANYLFGVIVLMMAVILLVMSLKKPRRIPVYITSLGVVVDEDFYPYKELKDFSIVYQPPEIRHLYLDFQSVWRPILSVDLEDVDPNLVRNALLPYVFENLEREDEHLTDTLKRVYKL